MQFIKKAGIILLIFALFICLCLPFLNNPLFFDDQYFFSKGVPEKFLEDGFKLYTRWWVHETFALTYVELNQKIFWLRLGNTLLQFSVAATLAVFIRNLMSSIDKRSNMPLSISVATALAALIFLVHPISTLTHGYLIQRTILCATLFSLLSLIAFWRGLSGKSSWLYLSFIFFIIAIYAKEHVVMLPFVAAMLAVLGARSDKESYTSWRKVTLTILAKTVVAVFVVFQLKGLIGTPYEINTNEVLELEANIDKNLLYPLSILNQITLFFKYLGLWVLPSPNMMSLDLRAPFPLQLFELSNIIGVCSFLLYISLGTYWLLRGGIVGLLGFSMLAPAALYFTEFSVIRIQEPFVLYRSYLWGVFLFIPIALIIRMVSFRLTIILGSAFLIFFTTMSFLRLKTYSHPIFVWQEAADIYEAQKEVAGVFGGYRIYYNLGTELNDLGFSDSAIKAFTRSIELKPNYGWSWNNRGAAYLSKQDYSSAQVDFEIAAKLLPGKEMPWRGMIAVLEKTNKEEELVIAQKVLCILQEKTECNFVEIKK